jgi:multicomponent Na+:H+ antiporter subunit G
MGGTVAEVLSWVFILSGAAFVVIGGIGLLRLPDFYTRIHAAGITDTMGAWLMLVGLMFQAGWTLVTVKLVMLLFFLLATSPLATHALAKAAYLRDLRPLLGPELTPEDDRD